MPIRIKPDPSQRELNEAFDYDWNKQALIWKYVARAHFKTERGWKIAATKLLGSVAGKFCGRYWRVQIFGARYALHRLIWIWHNGKIPDGLLIDHRNGNESDNRLSNLRIADASINIRNARMRRNNTSGATGVSWRRQNKRWVARCNLNGTHRHIGTFSSVSDAEMAVREFRADNGFTDRSGL